MLEWLNKVSTGLKHSLPSRHREKEVDAGNYLVGGRILQVCIILPPALNFQIFLGNKIDFVAMSTERKILSEEVLYKQGGFHKVKRYYQGKYPKLGKLIQPEKTLSKDWETVVEEDVIKAVKTFIVSDGQEKKKKID